MSLELGHPIRHHLFRLRFTELNEIYWFMVFRSIALSLVTIFVPIYLYKSNFGISNIFLYSVSLYFFEFIFELPAARFLKVKGPKHAMILSLPFMTLHLWQLFTLSQYGWSPVMLAIPLSISLAFFWEGYHYDFSRSKHRKNATKDVSKIFMALTVIGATAPLVGGLLATYLGMNWLLAIVITLFTAGSSILFRTKDTNFHRGKLDLRKVNLGTIDRHVVSYAGVGWQTASVAQIWPLFLFFIVSSYSGVGLITSLTLLVGIGVTYWISKRADKGKRIGYLRAGSAMSTVIGLLQIFVETVFQAFAINISRVVAECVMKPPFDSEYYLHADEESRSEYIYVMESAVDIARMVFYVILYILSLSFELPVVLIVGLLLGALGSPLISLMPAARCDICKEIVNKQIKVSRRLNA